METRTYRTNGRGKTTLLNILQNKLPYQGQVIHQQAFSIPRSKQKIKSFDLLCVK